VGLHGVMVMLVNRIGYWLEVMFIERKWRRVSLSHA
jgi:hypothetical protein